ncbi:MAG: hypothetical protein ACTSO8_05130 [Promethearchaeota archaeon]|jgi:hypothetical protein
MFEVILDDSAEKKHESKKIKRNQTETPLDKSIDKILDQINLDIVKILKYNRI